MAANMDAGAVIGDPDLDPGLRARVDAASAAVPVVLGAAGRLRHDDSVAQLHALALHGTIIEQFSACVLLAAWDEAISIPIILRSMYEALVDLDNLVQDAAYIGNMEAANIDQTLRIMDGGPLREEFQQRCRNDFQQLQVRLAELEASGRRKLTIRTRCERVGRLGEYESIYGLFCLDTHNNASALYDRHLAELPDGSPLISYFRTCEPETVARRLDFGLQFLFQSARLIHGAFRVPAPEVEAIAERFERERRERLAGRVDAVPG